MATRDIENLNQPDRDDAQDRRIRRTNVAIAMAFGYVALDIGVNIFSTFMANGINEIMPQTPSGARTAQYIGSENRSIYSGGYSTQNGITPYGLISSDLSLILYNNGHPGHGYTKPTTSILALQTLEQDSTGLATAIVQPDILAWYKAHTPNSTLSAIVDINVPECLYPITSDNNLNQTLSNKTPKKIGLLQQGSGSHFMATTILKQTLSHDEYDQIDFIHFKDAQNMISKVEKGELSAAFFTEVAAELNDDLTGNLNLIDESDLNIAHFPVKAYIDKLKGGSYGYYSITMPFNANNITGDHLNAVCTNNISIVANNARTIPDPLNQASAEIFQGNLKSLVKEIKNIAPFPMKRIM